MATIRVCYIYRYGHSEAILEEILRGKGGMKAKKRIHAL